MRFAVIALFFCSLASADPRSFSLKLSGVNGQPPHPNVDLFLRKMVAGIVENLKAKKYILRGVPEEGGFDVCIEPTEPDGYDYILDKISRISVNPRDATWLPELVENCDPIPEAKPRSTAHK